MTRKVDTAPLCPQHAALIDWYTAQGHPWPPKGGCDGIRATMKPTAPDATKWYRHDQLAALVGLSVTRVVYHRNHPKCPLEGVRRKDPGQKGAALRWFYSSDVVEKYVKWRADTEAKRADGRKKWKRVKAAK